MKTNSEANSRFPLAIILIQLILLLLNFAYGAAEPESNRVAIVVNKYLKQEIEDNLNIYLQDLKNEGYEPILKEWDLENDPAPQVLKAYLKGLYLAEGSLQGAVFIGDLPIPMMEADPSLKDVDSRQTHLIQITNGYIAERYYMDLVGKEWTDEDKNFKFEEPDYSSYWKSFLETLGYYTPETLKQIIGKEDLYPIPEIWTSRIVTSTLTSLFKKSEGQLVNAYLKKNHAYRTGKVVFQKQTLLYSLPDSLKNDSAFNESQFVKTRGILSNGYILKEPIPPPAQNEEFFKPLQNESYEILYWGRHGMPTFISLGTQNLTSNTLAVVPTKVSTAFIFAVSCWLGHYIEPAYFSGSYLFNERFYALSMLTATLPTYANPETLMISNFINNKNLGIAFKNAIEVPDFSSPYLIVLSSRIASSNSRFILGDGTLKLQSKELEANETNDPQEYIEKQYPYSEDLLYDYAQLSGGNIPELNDINILNKLSQIAFVHEDYGLLASFIRRSPTSFKDQDGSTLLHLAAAKKGAGAMIRFLITLGLDITAKNNLGKTTWDIAKENGNDAAMFNTAVESGTLELIKFLIENNANVNAEDKDNYTYSNNYININTPLNIATNRNDIEIIKTLIENGANINTADNNGFVPLMLTNDSETLKFLIKNGADVNAKNNDGKTRLHMATAYNEIEIIKILLENNADINAKDINGKTPLDIFQEGSSFDYMLLPEQLANKMEILKLLEDAKTKAEAKEEL